MTIQDGPSFEFAFELQTPSRSAGRNVGIRRADPEVMKRLLAGEAVDPGHVYFRTSPVFETAAADQLWLMNSLFVGIGRREPLSVIVRFWRIV